MCRRSTVKSAACNCHLHAEISTSNSPRFNVYTLRVHLGVKRGNCKPNTNRRLSDPPNLLSSTEKRCLSCTTSMPEPISCNRGQCRPQGNISFARAYRMSRTERAERYHPAHMLHISYISGTPQGKENEGETRDIGQQRQTKDSRLHPRICTKYPIPTAIRHHHIPFEIPP